MSFETPFEALIGLRYTSARKPGGGNRFISFISLISMLGLALGVAALIVVLSVMNGFQKELRTRILGVASHAQISGADGEMDNWQQAMDAVRAPSACGSGRALCAATGHALFRRTGERRAGARHSAGGGRSRRRFCRPHENGRAGTAAAGRVRHHSGRRTGLRAARLRGRQGDA